MATDVEWGTEPEANVDAIREMLEESFGKVFFFF